MTTNEKKSLDEIKSKGYWRIKIKPSSYQKKRFEIPNCKKMIISNQVKLRGIYYPHVDSVKEIFSGDDYVECISELIEHKEIWRLYQSGQFIQHRGFWEDWLANYRSQISFGMNRIVETKTVKSILMTLYTVTEIFLFMSRLASNLDGYKETDLSLRLSNVENRTLVVDDIFRTLHGTYTCRVNEINYSDTFSASDLIGNSLDLALNVVVNIFQKFNWNITEDSIKALKKDQEKFLKGLL